MIETPFNESDLVHFTAFLYTSGFSYSSILSRCSAVTFWCKLKGWPLIMHSFYVLRALRGVHVLSANRSRKGKFPITPDVLLKLCQALRGTAISDWDRVCLEAMFLLAFHAFLRVGEMCLSRHTLQWEDITLHSGYVAVQFPSYKFSLGRCPSVYLPARSSVLCPVKALAKFIQIRGFSPGSFFRDECGFPYSSHQFRSLLSCVTAVAGLSACGITPHCFRIGAATSAAAIGIPDETIQRMGHWSSRAFVRHIKFQINRF